MRGKKIRLAEISIERLNAAGNGIGTVHFENGVQCEVEVGFTIPGDRVRVQLLRKRKGIYESYLEEVLVFSEQRIKARCVHFGVCGGCRLQFLSYQDQLQEKENLVKTLLAPHLSPDTKFSSIAACDPPWEYRNKMEFSFHENRAGDKFLGLMMSGARGKVVNLNECHLVHPWFIDGLKAVRDWWQDSGLESFHPPSEKGSLRTLIVREGRRSGDRMVMLTVSGNPDYALTKAQVQSFVQVVRDATEPSNPDSRLIVFLRVQQAIKGRATQFYEMQLYGPDVIRETLHIQLEGRDPVNLEFNVSPQAFFQPNTQQAEKLYSLALSMAELPRDGVVYDLYCGTGTLGICAARVVRQVLGIELSPESALDARTNAQANGLSNMTILTGDVGATLTKIQVEKSYPLPDLVMVDPPRVGLDDQAIQNLLQLMPPKILYISCNPKTQAANLEKLTGYRLAAVQPVDQFPQTPHIENIVLLVKK